MATTVSDPTTAPAAVARRARAGDLDTFYLDVPGDGGPLVLLHGLSANAHSFGGLIATGLGRHFRVIAPDLRGRARSAKPDTGYLMADHARDVIALLDGLGLDRVTIAGHSFGGYLGIYLAANFPDRVERLVVIDSAITTHPRIGVMLKPSLDRLTRVAPSAAAYLAEVRGAAYLEGAWDEHVEQYFRAEVQENRDGTAQSLTSAAAIGQAAVGLSMEPWLHWVQHVAQPVLLLNALGPYGPAGAPPLMDEISARATARAFPDGEYVPVPGNHITMMFGEGATAIARAIERFALGSAATR
jgi:pimeloyl-ACP methyl ester carboxylesterase